MEKLILLIIFVSACCLVFRHVKNLMTKGEQGGCGDCLLNHLITSGKDKSRKQN